MPPASTSNAKAKPKADANAKPAAKKPARGGRKFVVRYDDENWVLPPPHGHYRGSIRQQEVGDESGRKHWKSYVEFGDPVSTKQCAEALNIPWVGVGKTREHSLYFAVACGTREENAAYCGSSLYCHTHSKGDFKLVFEGDQGKMIPDESFCECEDVKVKGQQDLPIVTGVWPSPLGGAAE